MVLKDSFWMAACMISAMSWAVVCWLSSGSPVGFVNTVLVHPSFCARVFICWTKPSTEPPTCSAICSAISLAEATIMAYRHCSTVKTSSTCEEILAPPSVTPETPVAVMVTSSVSCVFSRARRQVMILTVLPGKSTSSAFLE